MRFTSWDLALSEPVITRQNKHRAVDYMKDSINGTVIHEYSGKKKYVNPLELPGFQHKLGIKFELIFI